MGCSEARSRLGASSKTREYHLGFGSCSPALTRYSISFWQRPPFSMLSLLLREAMGLHFLRTANYERLIGSSSVRICERALL